MKLGDVRSGDAIADVAGASLSTSYGHFPDDGTVDRMVEAWYAPDRVEAKLGDRDARLGEDHGIVPDDGHWPREAVTTGPASPLLGLLLERLLPELLRLLL